MKRPVVEQTIRLLIAIAFSIQVASAQNRSFTIQVESWTSEADAKSSVAKLREQGLEAYWVKTTIPGMGVRYRVRIGRYPTQAQAKAKADQLLSAGAIKEFIVAIYDAEPSDSALLDETKSAASKSRSRRVKNTPQAKTEPGSVATQPRRGSNADDAEPAGDAPAAAEAPADLTIKNGAWKVMKLDGKFDKSLRAIYFVDSTFGWAAGAGGAVYHTADGGRSWESLSIDDAVDINYVYFIDRYRGWMLGKPAGADDEAGNDNVLFITTNGGRSWMRKPLPYVTSIHFIDARIGWAAGKNSTLLKTTDGGLEWNKVSSIEKLIRSPIDSSTYNFGFSDIHFTDPKHGWLIGNFYEQARGDIGGVFTTSDGGATWRRVPFTIQTKNNAGRFTPGSLHSVNFKDANAGSITGEMYDGADRFFFALHTRDGGQTWSLFRIQSRSTHNSQFLDPTHGWTAAFAQRANGGEPEIYDTVLLRTKSGGLSWGVDLIARGRRIRGIFFLSPTKGWAVGDGGMILSYEEKPKAN
ncbi:MAG TPA: YCF48-related protein [Blastocatellia bacterium]